jgi:hypothetical protein
MFAKSSDSLIRDEVANADGIIEGRRQEALLKTGALTTARIPVIALSANAIPREKEEK